MQQSHYYARGFTSMVIKSIRYIVKHTVSTWPGCKMADIRMFIKCVIDYPTHGAKVKNDYSALIVIQETVYVVNISILDKSMYVYVKVYMNRVYQGGHSGVYPCILWTSSLQILLFKWQNQITYLLTSYFLGVVKEQSQPFNTE